MRMFIDCKHFNKKDDKCLIEKDYKCPFDMQSTCKDFVRRDLD